MFAVLGGQLSLFDGPEGYRPSEDSFWLSCLLPPVPKNSDVLDLGCGTGAVILSYGQRHPGLNLWGLDHNPEMLHAAKHASEVNGLPLTLTEGDALTHPFHHQFDLSFANPPFYQKGREAQAQTKAKQNVRQTSGVNLWLEALLRATKPEGWVALICHKADSLGLIDHGVALGASCTHQFDLQSQAAKPAKRSVLIFKKQAGLAIVQHTLHTDDPALRDSALQKNISLYG